MAPATLPGLIAEVGAHIRVGEVRRFYKFFDPSDKEAQALLKAFVMALQSEEISFEAAAHATRRLQKFADAGLDKALAAQLKLETGTMFRSATYGRAAKAERLGEFAQDLELAKRNLDAETWAVVRSHLDDLNPAGDLRAFNTFQRMLSAMGPNDEGWAKLTALLAPYDKKKLAEEAEKLSSALKKLEGMPKGAKREALQKETESAKGIQSAIKGLLGEIYLARWPAIRAEMQEVLEDAQKAAQKMGEGWEAVHVVGNIKIDGKDAYDQAVVLLNKADRKVIVHTAIQMKVERKLSAFHQIERDVRRERRLKAAKKLQPDAPEPLSIPAVQMAPSVGQFEVQGENGERLLRSFTFEAPPDDMMTRRYVYFAEGPKLGTANGNKLKAIGVEARVMPVDLSVDAMNALALQIMLSAKKMK